MDLVDFVSFDDVRAALGVSKDEFTDATLSLDLYKFNLVSELESIDLTLIDAFLPLSESTPADLTAIETRFVQSVTLFSTYAVAKLATIALPMFGPKEKTDGKAGAVRFALDPYKATIARVLQQYDAFKAKLEAAFAATLSTTSAASVSRPYLSVVSPNSDPVLGT